MSVGGYTPNAKHSTSISCDCSYLNLASSFVMRAGGGAEASLTAVDHRHARTTVDHGHDLLEGVSPWANVLTFGVVSWISTHVK